MDRGAREKQAQERKLRKKLNRKANRLERLRVRKLEQKKNVDDLAAAREKIKELETALEAKKSQENDQGFLEFQHHHEDDPMDNKDEKIKILEAKLEKEEARSLEAIEMCIKNQEKEKILTEKVQEYERQIENYQRKCLESLSEIEKNTAEIMRLKQIANEVSGE